MKIVRLRGGGFAVKHGGLFYAEGGTGDLAVPQRVLELIKACGLDLDPTPYVLEGRLGVNRLLGEAFEECVAKTLSGYKVERHKKAFEPIGRIAGRRVHSFPDFVVEGKIAVEAKVGDCDEAQVLEYAKKFPVGAVVFPFSGFCRVPRGWRVFPWLVKDPKPFHDWLRISLGK